MAEGTFDVTGKNFEEVAARGGIVVLDWWAPWCGPCRAFAPRFEAVAKRNPDVAFGKVNTEEESELAGAFGIRSIPTLMVLRDRVLLYAEPGALSEAGLEDLLRQVRALDMEKVQAELAAREARGAAAGVPPPSSGS